MSSEALATVLTTGNVYPSDNPFPPFELTFEGLPIDGNVINPFDPPNAQITLEGIPDPNNPNVNLNLDVIVGLTSFGGVLIDGGSILRFQDLIIGDSGTVGTNNDPRIGTGVVRITGFGSTFNNDPAIMPTISTVPGMPPVMIRSVNPRLAGVGYDLIVGGAGNGTLEVSFGGRAEIEDGVIVGDVGVGTVLVTGADAFLGSGNFEGGAATDIHEMIIGRLGVGLMNITEGGQVFSNRIVGAGARGVIMGGVIGSDPFNLGGSERQVPRPGGQGTVTVDGFASKWIVGGTLQVGGYHNAAEGAAGTTDDIEGDNALYSPAVGRGTLTVSNQGLVSILPPAADAGPPELDSLQLTVGRFGRVNLAGGHIDLLGGFAPSMPGQDPELLDTPVAVVNDGIISGSGSIRTGQFRNRVLGEVHVGAGERLIIDSAGELLPPPEDIEPLQNFGLVRVIGTETARSTVEFNRTSADTTIPSVQDAQPFLNQRLGFFPPAAPPPIRIENGGRGFGLIHAQWATLQFPSGGFDAATGLLRPGMLNQGQMAFTAGDNIVSGIVVNRAARVAPNGENFARGVIFASGPDTTVVFEDHLINELGSGFIVEEGADVDILGLNTFVHAGELVMDVNPNNLSTISVAGNAGIGGKLTVRLSGFGAGSLQAGDLFPIITAGGVLGGVSFPDPLNPFRPALDLTKNPLFTEIQIDPLFSSLAASADLVLVPEYTINSVLLAVRSLMNLIGPDFNGDNIVDGGDLDIWRLNYGITMGATPRQGDADRDGDVDFDDFFIWQQQNGGAPMGFGAGAVLPDSAQLGTVPEPASAGLLAVGALLALALRCRSRRN